MKIKNGFTLRTVMGQNVILAEGANADTYGKLITLNDSAAMLWKALQGRDFDAETAADILVSHYGIPRSQALADATRFLTLLTDHALLV